jgi:hypothetical protein
MTMHRTLLGNLIVLAWIVAYHGSSAAPVIGATWTSPDGAISMTLPNVPDLVEVKAAPPVLAIWTTKDQSVRFIVAETPIPHGVALVQKTIENAFLQEIHGTLVSSTTFEVSGWPAFGMSARGRVGPRDATAVQSVIAAGDHAYTIAVLGIGQDIINSHEANEFVRRVRVLARNTAASAGGDANNSRVQETSPPVRAATDTAVAFGCVPLFVFVVYGVAVLLVRRFRGQRPTPQNDGWVNLYTIAAALCGVLAIGGCWENVKVVIRGTGLPVEPAARQAFIIGMFAVPVIFMLVAMGLVLLAVRRRRSPVTKAHLLAQSLTRGPGAGPASAADGHDAVPR